MKKEDYKEKRKFIRGEINKKNADKKFWKIIFKQKSCKVCETLFTFEEREYINKHSEFCSRSCANSKRKINYKNMKQKVFINRICKCCNQEFKPRNSNSIFCDCCKQTENMKIKIIKANNLKIFNNKTINLYYYIFLKLTKIINIERQKRIIYKNKTFNCKSCKKSLIKKDNKINNKKNHFCNKICFSNFLKTNSIYRKKQWKKISIWRKKRFSEWILKVYWWKTKWLDYKRIDGTSIKVQGSYEYRTCKILDIKQSLWKIKKWEYTNDRIPYLDLEWKEHSYLFDFKVFRNNWSFFYIEVKGFLKDIDIQKWESAKAQGYELQVWFLETIKKEEEKCGGS